VQKFNNDRHFCYWRWAQIGKIGHRRRAENVYTGVAKNEELKGEHSVAEQINLLNGKNLWKLPDGLNKDRRFLSLEVRNGGKSRAWAFRYTKPDGTKGRINVGPLAEVSLAEARKKADKYSAWLAQGKDPAVEKELETAETKKRSVTVNEVLDKFEKNKLGKRRTNTKISAEQSFRRIRDAVGTLPAVSITRHMLIEKLHLERLWHEKHVTCQQLAGYCNRIFKIVQKDFHLAENAGADLTIGFAPSRDVHTVQHHPPMHYSEVPEFLAAVRNYKLRGGAGKGEYHPNDALWCEAVFLTGVRQGEVRQAQWKEADWKTNTWNVPPAHRKTEEHHIRPIPITKSLLEVFWEMRRRYHPNGTDDDLAKSDDPIFPSERRSAKAGKLLPFPSDTIMKFIRWSLLWPRRLTAHSARNAFTGWAETKGYDPRLIDWQLDHLLPGESERAQKKRRNSAVDKAYRRDTLLEPRRKMMEHYDADCNRLEPFSANVTEFPNRRSA
jgi:integrase